MRSLWARLYRHYGGRPLWEDFVIRTTSRARRHLQTIERRLDALERRIRALEDLRATLQHPSDVTAVSHGEVMQEA